MRDDVGQIEKVRAMAVRIQTADPKFKPLRDAVHNQLSAGLIPQLEAYRDKLPPGSTRAQVDALIAEIGKLTAVDERALHEQVHGIEDAALRDELTRCCRPPNADPVDADRALGAAHGVGAPDGRRARTCRRPMRGG